MPAKKTRREPDAQADLIGHVRAQEEAFAWAEKELALHQARKEKVAQAAERKAREALHHAIDIKKRCPPITRERHMTKRDV